jgi:hypothetical protein
MLNVSASKVFDPPVSSSKRKMGNRHSGATPAQVREAAAKEWNARLARYFERYGKKPSAARLAVLVGRILEDAAVWQAILLKFGPELDPPHDQPPSSFDDDDMARRRRAQVGQQASSHNEYWINRLTRYFAKYAPEKSAADIERLFASVPRNDWADVWSSLLRKYGPEPSDVESTKTSDRASLLSASSTLTKLERKRRAEMIVKTVKHLRQFGVTTSVFEVAAMVDDHWSRLPQLAHAVQDKIAGASVLPPSERRPLTRNEWTFVIQSLDPARDPFAVEALLEEYDNKPGSYDELFLTLTILMEAPPPARDPNRELDAAEFWERRIRQLLADKNEMLTADEEAALFDQAATAGYASVWSAVTSRFGTEAPASEALWDRHREYWIHRLASLFDERFPAIGRQNVTRATIALARCTKRSEFQRVFDVAATDLGGQENREMDEVLTHQDVSIEIEDLLQQRQAQRSKWRAALIDFYAANDPSRLTGVDDVLDRAAKHPGGYERMWELLRAKYPNPPPVPTTAAHATEAAMSISKASEIVPMSPAPSHRKVAPDSPRTATKYWSLQCHVLRAAVGPRQTAAQLQKTLDRSGALDVTYRQLERDWCAWRWPMMDEAFWQWRYMRLEAQARREEPLLGLPDTTHPFATRYRMLRDTFRGDGHTAADAFEMYTSELEGEYTARHGWAHSEVSLVKEGVDEVGSREFWERRMHDHRQQQCPQLPAQEVTNILDAAEVSDRSYEDVWLPFVARCTLERRSHHKMGL